MKTIQCTRCFGKGFAYLGDGTTAPCWSCQGKTFLYVLELPPGMAAEDVDQFRVGFAEWVINRSKIPFKKEVA